MTSTWQLSSPLYFERDEDPEDQRSRLARDRHAEAVRQAEAELAGESFGSPAPDDWSPDAIVARVKAEADRRAEQTGAKVPAAIVWAAVELVDLLLEGAAQANVRDTDLAAQMNLAAVALAATGTAWTYADERARE